MIFYLGLYLGDDVDELAFSIAKVDFGSEPEMLEGEAVIDTGSQTLMGNGTREVLAVVSHDHDLPFFPIE